MTQKYPNGEKVISPGTVIVSAGGEVSDVKKVVSPVLVNDAKTTLYHIAVSYTHLVSFLLFPFCGTLCESVVKGTKNT